MSGFVRDEEADDWHSTKKVEARADLAKTRKEVRVVDPNTGGEKGSKLAKFSSIPPDVLFELAEHYGKGEEKYPNDPETGQPNWLKGYDWRLSEDALLRHVMLWLRGEDFDEETGTSHLVCAAWHAFGLRKMQIMGRGKDHRHHVADLIPPK